MSEQNHLPFEPPKIEAHRVIESKRTGRLAYILSVDEHRQKALVLTIDNGRFNLGFDFIRKFFYHFA